MSEIEIKTLNKPLDETNLGRLATLKKKAHKIFKRAYIKIFGYKKNIVKMDYPDVWLDADTRILYSNMQVLKEFVEEEMHIVLWEEATSTEIMTIYNWWKNYDNRKQEISTALSSWHTEFMRRDGIEVKECTDKDEKFCEMLNRPTEKENESNEKLNNLEQKLLDEEQDMLYRLVKIRSRLWT